MTGIPNTPKLSRLEYQLTWSSGKPRRQARERQRTGLDASLDFLGGGRNMSLTECRVRQHLDNDVDIEVVEDECGFTA
jgi:hypothetical protein